MKQSELYWQELLKNDTQEILIFCKDQIVTKDQNCFFSKESVSNILKNNITSVFLNNNKLVVNINFTEQLLNANDLTLQNVKKYITTFEGNNHIDILTSFQWITWDNRSKYCGTCGEKLISKLDTTEKNCTNCNISFFPRFSPAIMVLIKKDKQILLGRSAHFPKGVYSALAGFIDLGESAEEAVIREVREEVGISIKNIKYFGTQTWPFPDSFMIAFTADYKSGDIKIDNQELEDAKWFDIDKVPILPSSLSISRKLIESVLNKRGC